MHANPKLLGCWHRGGRGVTVQHNRRRPLIQLPRGFGGGPDLTKIFGPPPEQRSKQYSRQPYSHLTIEHEVRALLAEAKGHEAKDLGSGYGPMAAAGGDDRQAGLAGTLDIMAGEMGDEMNAPDDDPLLSTWKMAVRRALRRTE